MIIQSIPVQLGSLVLLSGPPGCGKSSACADLPPSLVVSSDRLRHTFYGTAPVVVDGQLAQRPQDVDDALVFSVMQQVVRSRLQIGLTTIVDATLLTDKQRQQFGAIADDLALPVQVIIFDLPEAQLQAQNQARSCPVPQTIVTDFNQRLQRDSKWPFTLVTGHGRLSPVIPTIPDELEVDAIGDVHGLADELWQLIAKLGYHRDFSHPDGRKLCFLGDLVDRGRQSLAVLDMVMAAIAQGHYCILGNHDRNLLRGLQGESIKSRSTSETLHYLLQQDHSYQERVKTFVRSLPSFYLHRDYVLCHADIDWFDPLEQPARERIYGKRKIYSTYDTDAVFRDTCSKRLVRGHIPPTTQSSNPVIQADRDTPKPSPGTVYALEEGAGFGGPMVAMQLSTMKKVRLPCAFDYSKKPPSFADQMTPLVNKKLVKRVNSPCGRLKLYKYTSKAFFTREAWTTYPELKLARGVVVGLHGEPISRPFPRTFNYLEQDTTLPLDTPVVAVEKLNGFLVTTFRHPYHPDELVISCSGSFEGDYVDMAKGLLYRQGLYGRVLDYGRSHPHHTLLWEAIHAKDPHIIPYGDDQEGLHLIGVGDGTVADPTLGFLSEGQLDEVAQPLQVPRPQWFETMFGEAIAQVRSVQHEGFMIRLQNGCFALKLKSPYYLQTKFLARMTEKKSKFMYQNPVQFKRELDEELWPLVDGVMAQVPQTDWLTWSDVARRDWVQTWMDAMMYASSIELA
ncbi:MAG: AAA family ATPase [Leptolyngbyaceae bacterium]|nr:AAA family ATPase [Leptolyngbyaceae bacterium]